MVKQKLLNIFQVLFGNTGLFSTTMGSFIKETIPLGLGFGQRGQRSAFRSLGMTGFAVFLVKVLDWT